MKLLEEIGTYVNGHKAAVANGSFGTGFKQAKMITDAMYMLVYFKKPTEEQSNETAKKFLNSILREGVHFLEAAPDTLFVFAAGNDGTDNDVYPTSPTNIKRHNAISVAATYKRDYLAPFSNYGMAMVDVAAPGMLIESTIPGDDHLKVSGTSQAAPYVANIATKMKAANPALKPAELKELLILTVDKKEYLASKVKSAGVVNPERAVMAADLMKSMSMNEAIERSKLSVQDYPETGSRENSYLDFHC
jgi:cell wall-associated protease